MLSPGGSIHLCCTYSVRVSPEERFDDLEGDMKDDLMENLCEELKLEMNSVSISAVSAHDKFSCRFDPIKLEF